MLFGGTSLGTVEFWTQRQGLFARSVRTARDFPGPVVDCVVLASEALLQQQKRDASSAFCVLACCKDDDRLFVKSSTDNFAAGRTFQVVGPSAQDRVVEEDAQGPDADVFSMAKMQVVQLDAGFKLLVASQHRTRPEVLVCDLLRN